MKKWVAVFLVIIFLLSGVMMVYGDEGDIKINYEVGFEGFYRGNYVTPINLTVENNLKDINGEIQIEIPCYVDLMGINAIDIYAIGINHPKGSTKKYTINVPIPYSLLNAKLKIVENEKILLEKYIRFGTNVGDSDNTLLLGVVSDNPENLNYLNGFIVKDINTNIIGTKLVNMDKESYFTDSDVMSNFNIIFMNDYDSSKLSDKQYNILKKWVEQGGFLIIGTGPNGSKTLSIFKDNFITGERGDLLNISGKTLGQMADGQFDQSIDIMDLNLENGKSILEQDGVKLAQYVDKGKGKILILGFDIGLEPLSSWKLNRSFIEKLVENTLKSSYKQNNTIDYIKDYERYSYNMQRALKAIPELPLPSYKFTITILVIYIILAVPVSYIVLKKKDRRELMWGVVPALSILFMVIIYFIGFGTRITAPIFHKISIVSGDKNGNLTSQSFGGVFSPNKTNLHVESMDDVMIKPLQDNYKYNSYTKLDDKNIRAKIMLSPKSNIEFYDVGVWNMETLVLDGDTGIRGSINSKINYENSGFKGLIENSTNMDWEDCYIIGFNEYMPIGSLKSGEKKEILGETKKFYGDRYDLLNSIYDIYVDRNDRKNMTEQEIQQVRENYQKRYILNYFFDSNYLDEKVGVKLIGWSKEPIGPAIKVNGKEVRTYYQSLLVSELNFSVQSGEYIELPLGYIQPVIDDKLNDGRYDHYTYIVHGEGDLEVSFDLGDEIIPESISIIGEDTKANVKQYIWNVEVEQWESGDFSNFTIESRDIKKYVDENNLLLFKFEVEKDTFRIPQITVKGRVK